MTQPVVMEKISQLLSSYELPEEAGFGQTMLPVMIICNFDGTKWGDLLLQEYGPLQIDPAAKVLHYAQEIFEGLKAYKNNSGDAYLFRPYMNAKRFNVSARRLAMPEFPEEKFVESITFLASLGHKFIPNKMGASLYFRPFMIGTEPTLGVKPATTYSYILIASPSDNYFSSSDVKVMIERDCARVAHGGTGFAKAGGNYASSLLSYKTTREKGCDQTLWLDAQENEYIEELSGMNFFAVVGDELQTPELTDTILSGITRDSLLKLATKFNLKPVEKKISITELLKDIESGKCKEVFACGTAAVITPISSLLDGDKTYKLEHPHGKVSLELKNELLLIQRGDSQNFKEEWCIPIPPMEY